MAGKNLGEIHDTVAVDTAPLSDPCFTCVYRGNVASDHWCSKFGAHIIAIKCDKYKERR